jgi:hypothetical protein
MHVPACVELRFNEVSFFGLSRTSFSEIDTSLFFIILCIEQTQLVLEWGFSVAIVRWRLGQHHLKDKLGRGTKEEKEGTKR